MEQYTKPGHSVLEEAQAIQDAKSQDYGDIDEARSDYFPFGHYSYLHMLHTKMRRLTALAENPNKPNFESAYDSVVDLINYAAFYGAFIKEGMVQEEQWINASNEANKTFTEVALEMEADNADNK